MRLRRMILQLRQIFFTDGWTLIDFPFERTGRQMDAYFGGTSLLIIVVVTMDFMAQVQSYVMTHQYENLLKKANFKNSGLMSR